MRDFPGGNQAMVDVTEAAPDAMPTKPRAPRRRKSSTTPRPASMDPQALGELVALALREHEPVLVAAAKSGHPPVLQIEPAVLALMDSPALSRECHADVAAAVEGAIEEVLRREGYVPVRAEPHELGGRRVQSFKVYFVKRAELALFDLVDRGEAVVLATTTDARRFGRGLIERYLLQPTSESPRRVFLWTIASGLFELTAAGDRVTYHPSGSPEPYVAEVTVRRLSDACEQSDESRADVLAAVMGGPHTMGQVDRGEAPPINFFRTTTHPDALDARHDILLDDFDGDAVMDISSFELMLLQARFEFEIRNQAAERDRWPPIGKDGKPGDRMSLPSLIDFIMQRETQDALFVIYDGEVFLGGDAHGQGKANISGAFLRDAGARLRRGAKGTQIVVLSTPTSVPASVKGEVAQLALPLPNRLELLSEVRRRTQGRIAGNDVPVAHPLQATDEMLNLVDAAAGMTLSDLAAAIRTACRASPGIASYDGIAEAITRVKRAAIQQSAALELVDREPPRQLRLGAMERFAKWLQVRHRVFRHPELASQVGINQRPKGVLILGIPGTGKSLAAKIIAREWQLPLVRLDMGAIQNRWVGASEERIREALAVVQAMSPCILWIDEIDKGIAQGEGSLSNSVDQNVRATLLTWLQENDSPVFVVATANRFTNLPPELTRAGRFDARFFFGCPNTPGREEILRIHLALRRPGLLSEEDFRAIAGGMVGFTGAEVEQAVLDALYVAFAEDRPPVAADFMDAAGRIKPLIRAVGKGLDEVWALIEQGRVELASDQFLTRAEVVRLIDPESFSPMYCRLETIGGWGRHAERATRILMRDQLGLPAAVVMKTGDEEWAYVQTNMRVEPGDVGQYKFLDRLATIDANGVFDMLVVQFGIEKVWFEDAQTHEAFMNCKGLACYSELFEVLPTVH